MKKRLFQIACVIFIISYLASLISNKDSSNVIPASDESKKNAIETLQLYQNVDSQLIAERNELYLLMLKHTVPYEEPSEADLSKFLNFIKATFFEKKSFYRPCSNFVATLSLQNIVTNLFDDFCSYYTFYRN